LRVVGGEGGRGGVVGEGGNRGGLGGGGGLEADDLASGGAGPLRVGGGLAVHPQVGASLLDEPIGLAGHDERVLGQADVQRLAAAPQREQDPFRPVGGPGRDRDRPLERGDGGAKCLGEVVAGGEPTGDEGREHLGVG